jgi:hypothetical protein
MSTPVHHLQILEVTTDEQKAKGLRQILIESRDQHEELKIGLTLACRQNVALDGESDRYEATGNLADNRAAALLTSLLTSALLTHPNLTQLPQA